MGLRLADLELQEVFGDAVDLLERLGVRDCSRRGGGREAGWGLGRSI